MKKFYFLLACLLCFAPVWGSVAPKPEMNFTLLYATENHPTILPDNSEQIQCSDNQCIQSAPLGHYGLQQLYCRPNGCFSIAYEYQPFQKLILAFSDNKLRVSNVFRTPTKLRGSFNVVVRDNDIVVEPTVYKPHINDLLRADAWSSLIIILVLELITAWLFLKYTGKSYRVLYSVFVLNLISMPVAWMMLGPVVTESWIIWLACLLFEAFFLWLLNRRRLALRDAFNLSLAINVTSYTVGMIISFLLAPYLF